MLIYNLNQSSKVSFCLCLSLLQLCFIDFHLSVGNTLEMCGRLIDLFLTPTTR